MFLNFSAIISLLLGYLGIVALYVDTNLLLSTADEFFSIGRLNAQNKKFWVAQKYFHASLDSFGDIVTKLSRSVCLSEDCQVFVDSTLKTLIESESHIHANLSATEFELENYGPSIIHSIHAAARNPHVYFHNHFASLNSVPKELKESSVMLAHEQLISDIINKEHDPYLSVVLEHSINLDSVSELSGFSSTLFHLVGIACPPFSDSPPLFNHVKIGCIMNFLIGEQAVASLFHNADDDDVIRGSTRDLFSSPIFVTNLLKHMVPKTFLKPFVEASDHGFDDMLASLNESSPFKFKRLADAYGNPRNRMNNEFFQWQMDLIDSCSRNGSLSCIGTGWDRLSKLEEYHRLYGHVRSAMVKLSSQMTKPIKIRRVDSRLYSWMSIHDLESKSYHPSHSHLDSMLSAVFYVQVPAMSGELVFEDPRGVPSLDDHRNCEIQMLPQKAKRRSSIHSDVSNQEACINQNMSTRLDSYISLAQSLLSLLDADDAVCDEKLKSILDNQFTAQQKMDLDHVHRILLSGWKDYHAMTCVDCDEMTKQEIGAKPNIRPTKSEDDISQRFLGLGNWLLNLVQTDDITCREAVKLLHELEKDQETISKLLSIVSPNDKSLHCHANSESILPSSPNIRSVVPIPPFTREYVFSPQEGDLIVFPSWLMHRVEPAKDVSDKTCQLKRISISFNLIGPWFA